MDTKENTGVSIDPSRTDTLNSSTQIADVYKLSQDLEAQLKESYPDVLLLINKLQRFIQKQQTKIKNLKSRLKRAHNVKDAAIQTCDSEEIQKNVLEEIKEAAEMAVQSSGFVYEETSGLYYDYNTGYYYNAELGLYYDGNSGTYMTYNQETESYEFHSQPEVPVGTSGTTPLADMKTNSEKRKKDYKENTKGCKRECSDVTIDRDLEEGECSDSSHSDRSQDNSDETLDTDLTEIAKGYPPCMRIIVKSTSVPKIKEGSLYIITYQGGTLGREGDHSIIIPDINISKHHLKITFDKEPNKFLITDLGSRNGTLLNGKRMSVSKQESEALEVTHGSCIQIGSTVLLCHIHSGNETCGHCEPGLLQNKEEIKEPKTNKNQTHKSGLKNLRKKFGMNQTNNDNTQLAEGYTDRAHVRRQTIGSHNENEKTEVSSVDKSISSENKGFKLLAKMGWTEGKSLGKEGTGVLNPVELKSTIGTTGMGYKGESSNSLIKSIKENVWEKTQKRYQQLPSVDNIFDESD